MNRDGCGIFPYIEPHVIHWPVNGTWPTGCHTNEGWGPENISGCVTYEQLNASVTDCVRHPQKYNRTATANLIVLCNEIAASALFGPDRERWFFRPENAPWNEGAMLYPGLNTATLADPRSRAAQLTAEVAGFYSAASAGNYSIDGVYIDSTQGFGAPFLLNFRPEALSDSRQPPVFDSSGGAAVLFAQDYLDFLGNLSDTLHRRGDRLFGNAMYMLPQIQFATAFDIAGIETGWQDSEGNFVPTPREDMAFVRAMSARKPYLYLMDTSFDSWSRQYTAMYHDICLLRGIWPGFFSANAFGDLYFSNATLYNRDRPVFRKYKGIRTSSHPNHQDPGDAE